MLDLRADVILQDDVERATARIAKEFPPLRGVVHAAMILDDLFIHDLDNASFNRVLQPKVIGAWNLHSATAKLSLDHFVCFSSVSSMIGTTKQANYSAANVFLDALASYRKSIGLPALTVNWGAIGGAGYFERNQKAKDYIDKVGFRSLFVPEALRTLRQLMQRSAAQICVAKADWEQLARFSPALGSLPMYTPLFREKTSTRSGGAVATRVLVAAPGEQAAVIEEFLAEQVAPVFGIEASQVGLHWPSVPRDLQRLSESGSVVPFTLSVDMFLQLMAFSAELNLPVSDILFAACQLTLHRFCNQPDLLIGYEFDGQERAEL